MRLRTVLLVNLLLAFLVPEMLSAREWTDSTGKFKVEAQLLTVRDKKAYLEKSDGTVVPVPLKILSASDLAHLRTLPDYRDLIPGPKFEGVVTVKLKVEDEDKVGEVRNFGDLGWGVDSLAFSPNAGELAVGKPDDALLLFDLNKSKMTSKADKLENLGDVNCTVYAPNNSILTGGYTGRIQVWDVKDGQLSLGIKFVGHTEEIESITVSSDSSTVLSGGKGKILCCWNLKTGREKFRIDGFERSIQATHITKSGKQGLASDGQTLALVDMETGKVIQKMELKGGSAHDVEISPNGLRVAVSASYDINIWNTQTGKQTTILKDRDIQWTMAFSPDSKYLICGARQKVNLWDVGKGQKLYEFDMEGSGYVQTLAYSPDRRHFAAATSNAGQGVQVFRLPADMAEEVEE